MATCQMVYVHARRGDGDEHCATEANGTSAARGGTFRAASLLQHRVGHSEAPPRPQAEPAARREVGIWAWTGPGADGAAGGLHGPCQHICGLQPARKRWMSLHFINEVSNCRC